MIGYNHSTLTIKNSRADSVAIKGLNIAVKVFDLIDGVAEINTNDFVAGQYTIQFFNGNDVIDEDELIIKQNLKYADANYDPRSTARQILDAINARLQNTATNTQLYVKVGQKEIRYMDYDQLIKWRNHYQKEVAREQGKPTQIRHEKLFYRGI